MDQLLFWPRLSLVILQRIDKNNGDTKIKHALTLLVLKGLK